MSDNFNARHPDSVFTATYPYNQATITRSGHEIHINDTPGSESLKVAHTSGTYVEIDSFGRWNQVIVDKAYNYYKDGFTETVDGHKDVKIHGALNQNVDGSIQEQVTGNRYNGIGGDSVNVIGGNHNIHVGVNKYENVDGDSVTAINMDDMRDVTGSMVTNVAGVKHEIIGGGWSVKSGLGGLELQTTGDTILKTNSFTVITPYGILSIGPTGVSFTGAALNITTVGPATITSAVTTSINGSTIQLNGV